MMVGALAVAAAPSEMDPGSAELVEFSGTVEWSTTNAVWTAVQTGVRLHTGNHLRTGPESRATLRLSDLSLVRLRENSLVELRPAAGGNARRNLFLRTGAAYFLNRERPMDIEFGTPLANGAIRGTEFLLESDAQGGATFLALFDGAVDLSTGSGPLQLSRGNQVTIPPTGEPVVTPALPARLLIQWVFYYPAVLVPTDLSWTTADRERFQGSLATYASGDLAAARRALPEARADDSAPVRVYRAALEISTGRTAAAEALLASVPPSEPGVTALRELMAAVTRAPQDANAPTAPVQASDWLARSYREQARFELESARNAARTATVLAPDSGYAWERLAELEFSLGRRDATRRALEQARTLSPRLAPAESLEGYVALEAGETAKALDWFNRAIQTDGGFGPAWLGRGLAHARGNEFLSAREDIQVATVLEPQRAVFRSYLGKAFAQTKQDHLADKDLRLARELDPADPTGWFYTALHDQQLNRVNDAVRNLERAVELNDNQAVFRSRWLLDQDLAVRNADLARIYADAGLQEPGRRAAQNAVAEDYSNFSAHLFQSQSLQLQEDPAQFNLRLESARESELLLANLLAPPGGGNLSSWASQQSSLSYLSPRRFGFSSFSGAASDGDLEQDVSFYGREAGFSYAVDGQARRLVLQQPNGQLEQFSLDARMQERLSDSDTLYVSLGGMRDERGDVASYYDPNSANRDLHVVETQEPSLFAGYHHEWSNESHTLALVSFVSDHLQLDNAKPGMFFLQQSGGEIVSVRTMPFLEQDLDSRFSLATAEAQQIWSTERHQLVAGARFQGGWVNSDSTLTQLSRTLDNAEVTSTMERAAAYAYYQWDPVAWIRLSGGVSYDALWYPTSVDLPPLSGQRETETHWSPKAALTLYPWRGGQFRGVYAQSLGGLYFDNSVRLEPGQFGGFTQAFRSLIPESVAGLVPGTTFETAGVAYDQVLDSGTYFGAEAVQLDSDGNRQVGAFTNSTPLPLPDELMGLTEDLSFRERGVTGYVSQLLGQSWTLGVRGSLSRAELDTGYPGLPPSTPGLDQLNTEQTATLGRVQMSVRYQHPLGWFAEGFGTWYHQTNGGADADLPGDSFWQGNVFVGFRWPRQVAEIRFGILNLSDQDYRLNPLNLLNAPPRTRTFVASLQFNL